MIMFTNRRRPILYIAAMKRVMRQKLNFKDGVARSPLNDKNWNLQYESRYIVN